MTAVVGSVELIGDGAAFSKSDGACMQKNMNGDSRSMSMGEEGSSPSKYEAQKRRDWTTFGQFLKNHRPPLPLPRCTPAHVLDFLRYLDQFGKTRVHAAGCPFFGLLSPPATCSCPLRQAWGSLDALIGRLRAAFEEHGGSPESNPFAAPAVRAHLHEVRETQAKARGIVYQKRKRRKRQLMISPGGAAVQILNRSSHLTIQSSSAGKLYPGAR